MKLLPAIYVPALLCLTSVVSFSQLSYANEDSYASIRIIEPERNEKILRPGDFSVIAEPSPSLKSGHRVQLFLDGAAHTIPNSEARFDVSSASTGQHTLQVKIIDQSAGVLESSAVRTIIVE